MIFSPHPANIFFAFIIDIESQIKDIQEKKKQTQAQEERNKGIGLLESGYFDSDIYDGKQKDKKYEGYVTSIATNEEDDEDDDEPIRPNDKRLSGFNAPTAFLKEITRVSQRFFFVISLIITLLFCCFQSEPDYDPFAETRVKTVGEKEDEYRQKRRKIAAISPERVDPFADGKC